MRKACSLTIKNCGMGKSSRLWICGYDGDETMEFIAINNSISEKDWIVDNTSSISYIKNVDTVDEISVLKSNSLEDNKGICSSSRKSTIADEFNIGEYRSIKEIKSMYSNAFHHMVEISFDDNDVFSPATILHITKNITDDIKNEICGLYQYLNMEIDIPFPSYEDIIGFISRKLLKRHMLVNENRFNNVDPRDLIPSDKCKLYIEAIHNDKYKPITIAELIDKNNVTMVRFVGIL